jgi:hypothetical protein
MDGSGLSLFIATNGTKSWHFRFTWHGKQPRMSLGTYSEITLKEAREQREHARALVAKGIDLWLQRREEKRAAASEAVKTFEVVANEWHAFKLPRWVTGDHRRRLSVTLLPGQGSDSGARQNSES